VAEGIELTEWIYALRTQLETAERRGQDSGKPMFVVGPVELELCVTTTREADANVGLKFWVVGAGTTMRASSDTVQRITLTLTPLREINVSDSVPDFDE
jgi:Trypsin-co-occurring domain 2